MARTRTTLPRRASSRWRAQCVMRRRLTHASRARSRAPRARCNSRRLEDGGNPDLQNLLLGRLRTSFGFSSRLRRRVGFLHARACKNAVQRVIAFVAGIFVEARWL